MQRMISNMGTLQKCKVLLQKQSSLHFCKIPEIGPSVTTSSTDFPFQNLVFWNLFEFSAAEIT
jgi:hypothetical protein